MKFSKELIEKAKTAKTAEELLAMAKEESIEMSAEQAAKAFAELNKTGELSDEELDNVAGGGCGGYPSSGACEAESKVEFCYNIGDRVYVKGIEFATIGPATILDRRAEMHGGYWYPYYLIRIDGTAADSWESQKYLKQ